MKVPLSKPYITKDEINEVVKVLKSGWLIHGPYTKKLEEQFSEYIGTKFAISANSCTTALQLALLANNLKGQVVLPSFTFVASANAVVNAGCVPVFVDIDPETCNINYKKIEEAINKKTVAIMVVHFAGQSCRMDKIVNITKKYKLLLIEDSAEAIGAEFDGEKTGSFGVGCFSFFPTKNMTMGEGGMITTNDRRLANRLKAYIAHGIDRTRKRMFPWQREAIYSGFNFRLMDIQAAIGLKQLKKLNWMNKSRIESANYLNKRLKDINELSLPYQVQNCKHVYQMYTPKIRSSSLNRDLLVNILNKRGIGASVHFDPPVHLQLFYRKNFKARFKLPVTEKISKTIFTLPLYPFMTKKELNFMIMTIKDTILQLKGGKN